MDHAGHCEQAGQLLRRVKDESAGALSGAGARAELRRRLLLAAAGAALLTTLAPSIARRAVAAQPPATLDEERTLAVSMGLLGPRLIEAGVIDPQRFIAACARSAEPLDERRLQVLIRGSDAAVAFDSSSAHFLLNLFWAFGLANANPVLTHGPMLRNGMSRIAGFASTGGWTLAAKPVMQIYARLALVTLNAVQQGRLEEATANVFRPCCDNPTSVPDCNHGMAMLGLLTLLAADDSDVDSLFHAAKTANRFWFPQQSLQLASYVRTTRGVPYDGLDARAASSQALFSASGFRKIASWAGERGVRAPGGSAC